MAQLPSNIYQIWESIRQTGVAFSNRYEMVFNTPQIFNRSSISELRNITVRCDTVTVPGRSFSTVPYRFYGPARNMPYEPIYSGEMSVSIILSADMRERKFFEEWSNLICSRNNYKFGYYDEYVTQAEITVLTRGEIPTQRFIIEEVYPKSIGDLQLSYEKDNDILKQEIVLSFRKYTPDYLGTPQNRAPQTPPPDPNTAVPPLLAKNRAPQILPTDPNTAVPPLLAR